MRGKVIVLFFLLFVGRARTFVALRVCEEEFARLISSQTLLVNDLSLEVSDRDEHAIERDGVEVLLGLELVMHQRRHPSFEQRARDTARCSWWAKGGGEGARAGAERKW